MNVSRLEIFEEYHKCKKFQSDNVEQLVLQYLQNKFNLPKNKVFNAKFKHYLNLYFFRQYKQKWQASHRKYNVFMETNLLWLNKQLSLSVAQMEKFNSTSNSENKRSGTY